MIDAAGKIVSVAWAPHEVLWVEAALTHDRKDWAADFQDIAGMSTRSFGSVQAKAYRILSERQEAELRAKFGIVSQARIVARKLPPSEIKPPSRALLMAGRA